MRSLATCPTMADEPIGVREAAKILGVHENTVRNWIRDGRLASIQYGGFRKLSRQQVERVAQQLPAMPDFSPDADRAYEAGYRQGWEDARRQIESAARAMRRAPGVSEP